MRLHQFETMCSLFRVLLQRFRLRGFQIILHAWYFGNSVCLSSQDTSVSLDSLLATLVIGVVIAL